MDDFAFVPPSLETSVESSSRGYALHQSPAAPEDQAVVPPRHLELRADGADGVWLKVEVEVVVVVVVFGIYGMFMINM